jgi:poly(3-hydroxybutyrate) depolymerase
MRAPRLALLAGLVVASCLVKGMDVDPALDDGGAGSGASNGKAGSSESGSPGSGGSSTAGKSNGGGDAGAGNESGGDSGSPANGGATSSGSGGSAMAGNGGAQVGGGGSGGSSTAEPSEGCEKTSQVTFGDVPGEPPNGFGEGGYVTIVKEGVTRGFALRLPDDYDSSRPYPLIFGFHANTYTAAAIDSGGPNGYEMAHFGLQKLSNNGAIFVAPDGIENRWANTDGRDLQFVDDMVALIQDNYCVDKKRVFANGFSASGGGMAHAIACARANIFAGVAIYNGWDTSGCEGGSDPIPYWIMAGLTDSIVSINASIPMRDRFVANNGCTVPAEEPQRPPSPTPGGYLNPGGHICTDYSGCSSGFPVRWCVHQSGHTNMPVDGTSALDNPCSVDEACSANCACSWVPQDVWSFFSSL